MNNFTFNCLTSLCKQGIKRSKTTSAFLILFLFSVSVQAALTGTYTIDGGSPASSTNYQSFDAAVSDLKTGIRPDGGTPNGSGVSGPVVFSVAAGTYTGQLDITAITGVSATNTITFDGGAGNAATRIITYSGAASLATAYTVRINNSQYIRFYNLTIEAASPGFGWPLHVFNNSSNTKVKNCIITFTSSYTTHTNTNFCAVVVNNSTASPTSSGTSANGIEIDSNKIYGGYGNYLFGAGTNTGIYFRNNNVDSTNYYGVYCYNNQQADIIANNFTMSPTGNINGQGIYVYMGASNANNLYKVNGNRIRNAANIGVYLTGSNTSATTRSQLINNSIGGGFRNTNSPAGIYFASNMYNFDVFHNSVNMDAPATATNSAAFYLTSCCTQGATLLDVRNNIFAVTNPTSSAYTVYFSNGYNYAVTGASGFDYNLFYKAGASNSDNIFYNGGNYLTPVTIIGNNGYNANSIYKNPSFIANDSLLSIDPCNNGTLITGITKDIAGNTRSGTAPDIGAYEASALANDIGIEKIISPTLPFNAGMQNISVVLKNYGNNTITSANISYSVNGSFPITYFYTGSLAPCASTTITFTGGQQFNFVANTAYDIKVFTDFPNATSDAMLLNDTARIPLIFSALSGNYTIDQGSPASFSNFQSFTAAVAALNNGGVNGPVTFTVMGNTSYNEQVALNNVPGVSATNTITFDGGAGNAANRILTFNTSLQSASHVFRINSTPWVTLRNLTLRSTGSSYGWPVHIFGNASSNTKVKNCIINYIGGNGATSGGSQNFVGIVINNSTTSVSSTSTAFNIELDSNSITGGDAGIYIYSSSAENHNIRYNTITDVNYYGVYAFLLYSSRINNNTINMRSSGTANSMGISMNNCYGYGTFPHELKNNVITNAGQYGMYLYYFSYGASGLQRGKVINNMIGGTFRSTDPSGIYMTQNVSNVDVWFNSVNMTNIATATQSAAFKAITNVAGLDVRNNNFTVSDGNSSSYAIYSDFAANFNTLDYNNLFTQNPARTMNIAGTTYSSGNFKGALGHNVNSVAINPSYLSSSNLKTTLLCNKGVAISSVTTDFEGDTRGAIPDIGADENMSTTANDLTVVQLLTPTVPLNAGEQNMRVQIKNNGNTAIYSADISYSVNGGAPMTQTWTGMLNPCDTAVVEFNATSGLGGVDQRFKIVPGFSYSFKVYSASPNSTTDGNTLNDTIIFGPLCPSLAGQYYIDSSATVAGVDTFTSVQNAVFALNCGGITGPVVFNVLKGTYNGQLTINDVQGVSSVNTITFDGGAGNDSTRIIAHASVATGSRHTIQINNARYIHFRNLTIRAKGTTYGWPLHIMGSSNNISAKNCVIDFEGNGVNGTSTNYIGVVMNNSTTSPTTTGTFNNIDVSNNKIAGGYGNMYISGNGTNTSISVLNNKIYNAYYYGFYVTNIIAPKLINNEVNMRLTGTTASMGIYLNSQITNATGFTSVSRNRVYDAGQYGIYLNGGTVSVLRPMLLNNSVGGTFRNTSSFNGIYVNSSTGWNINYNSVLIDTPSSATGATSGAIYINGSTNLDCRNNSFVVISATAGANVFAFRSTSSSTFPNNGLDYNNYFVGGTPTNIIQVNGTNYTPANFNTATAGGVNALNNNAGYIQGTGKDLIPVLAGNNGIDIPAITNRDINDSIRNNPPDMGAFEIPSGLTTDLAIIRTISPDTALSSGPKLVSVVVKNFGLSAITSFNLRHTVNGAGMQDSAFSGLNIAPNDELTITLDASKSAIIPGGITTIYKVYLHNPNGTIDGNQVNDTITIGPRIPTLNGVYTINPAGSGVTNFVSFNAAVTALNVAGVSGAVTFMVAPGTYTEQVTLNAINGVSAANTITFNGGNAATAILEYAGTSTSNYWTVKLNNSPYVGFMNLTIQTTGASNGVAMQISGTSDYARVKNCIINITGNGGMTSTTNNFGGLLISNTTTSTSPNNGIRVNNIEIDSNTFNYGYYGIYSYGLTSQPYSNNNKYRGNTFNNQYYYGAYYYYNEAIKFTGNTVALRGYNGTSYGLYLNGCQNTTTNYHEITANSFNRVNRYGIYISSGNAVQRNQLTNNMVRGFGHVNAYGLYITNAYNWDIYHNTVSLDTFTNNQQYATFYLSGGSNFDIKNNIFASNALAQGIPLFINGIPSGYLILNYNNYYKYNQTASTTLFYINGTTYGASNIVGGNGYNANSVSVNPGFVSNTDLHLTNACAGRGIGIASVTTDIDGNLRNALPNMGADEGSGLPNDVGLEVIKPFTVGLQDVKVVIRNYGGNVITSVNVAYSINGGISKITQWTGTLNPCDTATVSFTGGNQFNFQSGTAYTIEAYTSLPNFATDPKTSNDTLVLGPVCVSLNGIYTINATGSGSNNFTSINDAVSALACGGVSGPVTFKIAAGTYNEQVNITNINGTSATNRITFEADSAHLTTITYAASVNTQPHTIRIDNSSYITLRRLTIQTTGSNYGVGLQIMGHGNGNQVKNCVIVNAGSGATSTSSYFIPLLVNNFDNITNPSSGTGTQLTGLEIDSNILTNGYYGLYVYGSYNSPYASGVLIRNNRIDSSYQYGTYINYLNGVDLSYNTVNMRVNGSVSSYGMTLQNGYFANGTNIFNVTNNKVTNAGQYGFYMYQNYNGSSTYRSRFINNVAAGGFRYNQATAIYFRYANYWDIWNNSANLDFPTTQGQYAAMYVSDGSAQNVRNNMLVNSATSGSGLPFFGGSTTIFNGLDYNNYYNAAGSGLLSVGATFTGADFINGAGFNANGKNQNPAFASANDLHLGSGCINGVTIAGITTDYDGNLRNSPPDIGAYEFTNSLSNDIGVSFINSPQSPFTPGLQDVVLRINNYGVNNINSVAVSYSINGGLPKTVNWSGSLAPCDTTSVVFTGANQYNFAAGGSYTIKAYTSSPNSVADANNINDTLSYTSCPALSGTYTINPAGSGISNFTTITAAANALSCGGVSSPVNFIISSGTYNEQFTIGSIAGASATNTVEFRSATGNAADVILTYNSTVFTSNYVMNVLGADRVRFSNITFAPTNTNYGVAVQLGGSADYNTFDSCVFNGVAVSTTSNYHALIYVNGSKDNYNTVINSVFNNGAYGVYWNATSPQYAVGNLFTKNTFNNQYYSGMYFYYMDYLRITSNVFNANTSYTNYNGINTWFTYNTTGASVISKNKITGNVGAGYGLYLYYNNYGSSSANRFLISNNVISLNASTTTALYGIATYYSYYMDVMHNTVSITSQPAATSYAFRNTNFFSTGCEIKNNVFVNNTTGSTSYAVAEQQSSAGVWNNNDYYSNGTNLAQWGGTAQATLTAWRTASSNQDLNSFNLLPQFVSATNLMFTNLPCLNNGGANVLTKVPDDYEGIARTATPDIGAFEFNPDSLDATAEIIYTPSGSVTIGNFYDVVVRVRNGGTNVLNTLNVSYRVNGGTPVTRSFTGLTLNPCDTMLVTFNSTSGPGSTDQRYQAGGGLSDIQAFTSSPNAQADLNNNNDTTSVILCTPFAGTFNINSSLPLSATNFPSFTSAINALNGCGGITGPVVFNVAAGTYNEQLDIPAITGASAVNTVTFDGGAGNAASRLLTYSSGANAARHTLRLNNAQYITVKNITIQTTGASYGWGVHLYGSAHNNTISNCIIDIAGAASTSTSQNFAGIVSSGSTTSATTGQRIDSLTIDSNTINNGYYGIMLYGNTSSLGVENVIRGNTINRAYYYGVYLYYLNAFKLNNNIITNRIGTTASTNSTAVYATNCTATDTSFHEVIGNSITDATNVGIQFQTVTTASAAVRSKMWNNMLNGGFTYQYGYGIYMQSCSNWDVYHNTVNHDATTTNQQYAACYISSGSSNAVKNNIFVSSGNGSSGLAFYANSTAALPAIGFNYNMFHKVGNAATSNIVYYQGTYTNTSVIGGNGANFNSYVQNPNFLGSRNLHVKDGCFNGDSLGVVYDFDGNTRASYADIGADEVPSDSNDIGVQFMLKPGVPIAAGLQDVEVIIKNFGSKDVYGGTVSYSVNNGTPVSIIFSDTLTPCDTALITFTGAQQYNFVLGQSYELKIYTSLPNGMTDLYMENDTFSTGNICLGMAGNYTIDPAGSGPNNYLNFNAAVNALLCGGVAGPVTFDVAAGTYNEQVNIPFIPGASATNTIVFTGGAGNASSRILTYAATAQADAHTVRFNTTSFVEFNNMTIRGTGATYAWPVHIYGPSNSVKVRNSRIEVFQSNTSTNYIPVVMSGSFTSIYTQAKQDSIELDSNTIVNGYASIWTYNSGGVNIKVTNNTLNNPYYYGMYLFITNSVKVNNNTINMSTSGDVLSQGIYLYNSSVTSNLPIEVTNNKIYDMGQYGINSYFSSGTFAVPALLANNMVTGFRNTTSHAGFYMDYSNYWNIYHNTVNSDMPTTGTGGVLTFANTSSQNDVRNNIFAVTGANSAMFAFYSATGAVSQFNYNNFYKEGNSSNLIYFGATYGSSNFTGVSGFNINSFSRNPLFASARDLHVGNGCNNGVVLAVVTTDIDGDIRVSPPDVGADEVTTGINDNVGVISILSPRAPLTAGAQDIQVVVGNLGNNLVTSCMVEYSVNGGTPVSMFFNDSIQPCDTAIVTFTGFNQYTFAVGGSYTIKAYAYQPNGVQDNNSLDDTSSVGPVCIALSGAYTIDPAGSGITNYTTFNAAVAALTCGGVSGPVTFTVADATYNEQVDIGTIPGIHDTARVTFTGSSVNGTILNYMSANANNSHTLRLNNSPYINFSRMTIQASGASLGTAVHILGNSNYAKIKNCLIRINGTGAASTSTYFIPVLINNSTDINSLTANSGTGVTNIEIDSNRIYSGYYSIYANGKNSAPVANGLYFRRNIIDSSYYSGAYFNSNIAGINFINNEINMRVNGASNSAGLYFNNCYAMGTITQGHNISNNKIINAAQYGMYLYQSFTTTSLRSRVVNNMIGGGFKHANSTGIYSAYNYYWDFFHNSVNLDVATNNTQYSAMYIVSPNQNDIRNNLFVYSATSGSGLPFSTNQTTGFTALNYNNLYNYSSPNVIAIAGTVYDSVTFIGQSALNANSTALLTPYANSKNLHLNASPSNKGVTIASVTADIDGETRLSPPDIGADEYFSSMDIGVFVIDSPSAASFCGANKNLVVRLKNYGNQTVVNANIDIVLNGFYYTSYYWTGNLPGGATSAQVNLGSFGFTSGSYDIKVSTHSPNSGTDVNAANDTAFKSFTITPSVYPAISLSASQTTLCSGVEVTFIAQYSGGGTSPILQWRKNGLTIPFTGDTLKTTTLSDKDSFVVILTSSAACATPQSVVSNDIKLNVGTTVAPVATMNVSATTICAGQNVEFTASHLNGGFTPKYTWIKNGAVVGDSTATYSDSGLADGDSVRVILNSSLGCATPPKDTSAYVKITVNPLLAPSATITASSTSFCATSSITFAATTVNPGTAPFYQWKRNGLNIGFNNDTLIVNNLADGDSISLVLTSNAVCATPPVVESNKIGVDVIALVTPSVSIATSNQTICTGGNASFTATPVNAGVNATYNWTVNSVPSGTGNTFSSSALSHRDTVRLIVTADTLCASPQMVTSNGVVMNVKQYVTPDVTITPLTSSVCNGGTVSFTATPVNGGTAPSYQWIRNGSVVGTDSVKYLGTFTALDSVAVILTSNEMCLSKASDTSAYGVVSITPPVTPAVSIASSSDSVCANGSLTFTATPVNGGTAPAYQWKKNGINVGTNSAVQSFSNIAATDVFTVVLTSNAGCAVPATATSSNFQVTVIPNVTPSVSITASEDTICGGSSVIFTATPVNGGSNPSYQWKRNNANVGTNAAIQTFSGINNNDNYTVVMTSNAMCVLPATATSAGQRITVTPNVTPTVSIGANKSSICLGESVTYTATTTNGGTAPMYQWKVNGVNAGTNSNVFTSTTISGTDSVYVEFTSSMVCVTAPVVTSNKIKLNANAPVIPSVSIAASSTSACTGTSITFVATPVNGGTTPNFQWKVNGSNVGSNNDSLVRVLNNNDSVTVVMTSSALCASPSSVTSNKIGVTVSSSLTPDVTIEASVNTICKGESVTYTATPVNGGTTPTYKWLQNGVEVGTNSNTYTTTTLQQDEDVTCIMTTSLTCVSSQTATTFAPSVLVKAIPAKPVVTRTANVLSTSLIYDGYQWMRNDTNLNGATTRNFNLVINGQYSVKVDSNGCNATSDKFNVTDMVGINEVSTIGNIELYPNPATTSAYLNVNFTTTEQTEINITDMYGKLVRTIPVGNVNSYNSNIDMSEYADGVYFILIKHGGDVSQKRLVKAD